MAGQLGTIQGQIDLDVRNAMDAYTSLRQYHLSTFSAMGQAHSTLESLGTGFMSFGKTVGGALIKAGTAWGDFERKVDYIGAVAGATDKEMDKLTQTIMKLGAETIYTNTDIADGFTELAKAGVTVEEIVGGIGEGITHLGAAADIGLSEASTIMMSVIATWGKAKEEAAGVADTLAGAANASMVEISDLGVSMKYAGGVAASMGVSFEDVATALAVVGQRSIKGSTAGTNLRQILLGLTGTTKKATTEMKNLGIITDDGANKFFTAEGKVKSLAEVTDVLRDATDGMSDAQRAASLRTMFGIRQFPTLVAWLDAGSKGFNKMAKEIEKTKAAEVAAARLDNFAGDIEYLTGEIDNLTLSLGYLIASTLRPLAQALEKVAAWFNGLSGTTKTLIINTAAVVSIMSLLAGGILRAAGMASFLILQILQLRIALINLGGAAALARTLLARVFTPPVVILLIAAAIAALVGALVYFFTKTEQGQAIWAQLTDAFQAFMSGPGAQLIQLFTEIASTVAGALGTGLSNLMGILTGVGSGMSSAASGVGSLLSSGLQIVTGLFSVVGQVLTTLVMPIVSALAPVFAEFASAISSVSTNMSGMAGFADIIGQVLAAVINMAAQLIVVFIELGVQLLVAVIGMIPTIVNGFVTLVTTILSVVVSMLPVLVQAFAQGLTALVSAVVTVLPMLIQAFVGLITTLIPALVGMIPMIIQAGLQLFLGLVQALVTAIPIIVQALVTMIPVIINAIVMAIPLLLNAGIQLFMALIEAIMIIIPQLITALAEAIPMILEALIGAIPLILEAGIQAFMAIVEAIPTIIPQLITAIIGLLPTIISTVISLIPMLIQAAITLFMAIVQAIPQIISALIPAIIGLLPSIINTVVSMIPQLISAAKQLFMAIVQAIPQIVGALVSALIDLGTQMINGLVAGLQNAGGAVLEAIGGIVNGAIDWAKGLLGIKSPSRVFKKIGDQVGQGMAIGIKGTEAQVTKAVNSMLKSSKDAFSSLVNERTAAQKKLDNLQFKQRNAKKWSPVTDRQIKQTQAEIRALNSAIAKQSATVKSMETANKSLIKQAQQREILTNRLKAAQKNLKKLQDGKDDFFGDFVSGSQDRANVTGKKTVDGMIYGVKDQIEKTKTFNKLISDLKARGLDQQSLTELIEDFAQNGNLSAAKTLAAGSNESIKELANLRKQLGVEAEKAGTDASKIMYTAGIAIAEGIVKGIEKELAAVNAAAKKIANTLTSTVKKQLGIKSPSREMAEIGHFVMVGLVNGVESEQERLSRLLKDMAGQMLTFADDLMKTRKFEVETQLAMKASTLVAARTQTTSSESLLATKLDNLTTKLAELTDRGGDTYEFGDILIPMDELAQLKTLEDFIKMLKVKKKQRGGR